jgi:hypothetical protein
MEMELKVISSVSNFEIVNMVYGMDIRRDRYYFVRFEVIIFWEMTPCGSYKNRRFGGSYHLHLQGARVRVRLCAYTRAYNFAL